MKKSTFFLLLTVLCGTIMAQQVQQRNLSLFKTSKDQKVKVEGIHKSFMPSKSYKSVKSTAIFSEDFEDGATTFPPTDWTAQSDGNSSGVEEWHFADHYFDGDSPGPSNARNCAAIEYATAVNQLDEWLITPAITIPASGAYDLEYDWMSSYYWHVDPNDNGDIEVVVSTDGGTSWSAPIWAEQDQTLLEASGAPLEWETFQWYHARIDLSAYLGEDIQIAFHFVGMDAAFYYIDDVMVVERNANDLEKNNIFAHYFYTNGGTYAKIPQDQIMGGLYGASFTNVGVDDQTNVSLNVVVNKDGSEIYNKVATEVFASFTAGQHDTIMMDGDSAFVADGVGEYQAIINIFQDEEDDAPENNSDTAYMTVTPNTFARHYNVDYFVGPLNYDGSVDGDFFGSTFHLIDQDTLYGVRVFIDEMSNSGGALYGVVYDGDNNEVLRTDEFTVLPEHIGQFVVIPFLDYTGEDLVVDGDVDYTVGVEIYCAPDTLLIGADNSTSYQYLNISTAIQLNSEWYYTDIQPGIELLTDGWQYTETPALALSEDLTVYPNPADDQVTIPNTLGAQIAVFDMQGRLIENRTSTIHQTIMDISDYKDGIYMIKVLKGGKMRTHALCVAH